MGIDPSEVKPPFTILTLLLSLRRPLTRPRKLLSIPEVSRPAIVLVSRDTAPVEPSPADETLCVPLLCLLSHAREIRMLTRHPLELTVYKSHRLLTPIPFSVPAPPADEERRVVVLNSFRQRVDLLLHL